MEFKFILGVDMSKEWFHFCLQDRNFTILWEDQVANQPDTIFDFISRLLKQPEIQQLDELLLCLEHTGIYVQHLVRCWLSKGGRLSLIPATKVSQQLAGVQGWSEKLDFLDARRLAEYGLRFADKLELWQLKSEVLEKLQRLHRQRERLLKVINILQVPVQESLEFDTVAISAELQANQADSIQALKRDLKKVEARMTQLIEQDEYLATLFELITSVEGVGPVTAREILVSTEAFTKFTPQEAKRYARFVGAIPMEWESGSSVKKRKKTPKRSNQKVKSLLTTGAVSLLQTSGELAQYYHRKRQEGKAHLSVINAMRNKIILRVFAVVRNQVMYEKNLNFCLVNP